LAYAGLADCYGIYRVYGWTPAAENLVFWLETQLRLPRGDAELREADPRSAAETLAERIRSSASNAELLSSL